jgi:hypothetical protein
VLTLRVDFEPDDRLAVSGHEGAHPVHDTVTRAYSI